MKHIIKIILAISLISSVGCWSAENTNTANTAIVTNATNTTNTADTTDTTTAANTANTTNSPSEANVPVSGSPMETLKALNAASKAKNPAAIKKTLSKGTLAMIETSAKNQKKSSDALLREDDGAPFKELPEMRNEQISGSTATVEVKNTTSGGWEKIPFVVEDGEWKVALDKYLENLKKEFDEEQRKNPPTVK